MRIVSVVSEDDVWNASSSIARNRFHFGSDKGHELSGRPSGAAREYAGPTKSSAAFLASLSRTPIALKTTQ
jgi:hypothetical protein